MSMNGKHRWPCCFLTGLALVVLASSAKGQQEEYEKLLPPALEDFQGFGSASALDGDFLAVGAINPPPDGTVYLFEQVGSSWSVVGTIVGPADADLFGRPLSLQGDWLIVGDSSNDNVNTNAGAAYVYRKTPQGWSLVQKLVDPAGSPTASFSVRMDLRFPLLAISVAGGYGVAQGSGKVLVYEWNGSAWVLQSTLVPRFGAFGWVFGSAVAIDASLDCIVVGAENESISLGAQGAAYVFEKEGSEWVQSTRLCDPNGAAGQQFGQAVAIDGSTMLIGADGDDDVGNAAGAAWFYERTGNRWRPTQKVYSSIPFPSQRFGSQVGLSGATAVISSYGITLLDRVYHFQRVNGTWLESAQLVTSEQTGVDGYPENITYEGGNLVLSGANSALTAGTPAGAVYVHILDTPPTPYCTGKTNSLGCIPKVSYAGTPTLTGQDDFSVTAFDVLPLRPGLLFFGQSGALNTPFLGGTLCVSPPLKRTGVQLATAGLACGGTYAFTFSQAFMQSEGLAPSDSVHCQYWMRDSEHPDGTGVGLSEALEFFVQP